MIRGHGGEVYHLAREMGLSPGEILDFSSNVSPLPPPEGLYDLLQRHLSEIEHLPEADSFTLRRALARRFGLSEEAFFPSSGTTEWIFALPEALNPQRVLILGPTYADYEDAAGRAGVRAHYILARKEEDFQPPLEELEDLIAPGDLVFICNPNNPTGAFLKRDTLYGLISRHPEAVFVVDESYLPFAAEDTESLLSARPFPENLVVLFSFSKIYRIPGLRLGLATAEGPLSEVLRGRELPWAVNRLAQVAGEFLVGQREHEARVRKFLAEERPRVSLRLSALGLSVFPSRTNFLLVELPEGISGKEIRDRLLTEVRLLIRACGNFRGLSDRFIRLALRLPEENDKLLYTLEQVLKDLS